MKRYEFGPLSRNYGAGTRGDESRQAVQLFWAELYAKA